MLLTSGCSPEGQPVVASDCEAQIRFSGLTYTANESTDRSATEYRTAEKAACRDTQEDSDGSHFPESPQRVATWRFAGFPPSQVLGVRPAGQGSYQVFVADTVDPSQRAKIHLSLTNDERGKGPSRR